MNSITHHLKTRIPKPGTGANAPGSSSAAPSDAAKNKGSKQPAGRPAPESPEATGSAFARRPAKAAGESTAHVPPGGGDHDDLQRRFQALKDSMPRPAVRTGGAPTPTPGGGYLSKLQQKHFERQKPNASGAGEPAAQAWNFPFDDPNPHAAAHPTPVATSSTGASAAAGGPVPSKAGETAGSGHAGGNPSGSASEVASEGKKPASESQDPTGGDAPSKTEWLQGFSKREKIIGGVALAGLALWALDKSGQSGGQGNGSAAQGGVQP